MLYVSTPDASHFSSLSLVLFNHSFRLSQESLRKSTSANERIAAAAVAAGFFGPGESREKPLSGTQASPAAAAAESGSPASSPVPSYLQAAARSSPAVKEGRDIDLNGGRLGGAGCLSSAAKFHPPDPARLTVGRDAYSSATATQQPIPAQWGTMPTASARWKSPPPGAATAAAGGGGGTSVGFDASDPWVQHTVGLYRALAAAEGRRGGSLPPEPCSAAALLLEATGGRLPTPALESCWDYE